ncbi:MAG TPA: tyrosine-type recombinase/integrase, partial [Ktedonobacterales bacterium]
RKSFYGDTRREVQEQLTTALHDIQQGTPIVADRQSVEQFFTDWLANMKLKIRYNTWQRYEQYVRLYLVPTLGKVALSKLTPQQIQSLYTAKLNEGYSTTTIAHLHTVIHHALDSALRFGLVQRNVAEFVEPPKVRKVEMKTLSPEQARKLLEVARGERFEALYVVALTTGMRLGELLALRWQDVDLQQGRLQVRVTLQRAPKGFALYHPKTQRSRRNVALTQLAIDALREYRKRQDEQRALLGAAWRDLDLVFSNLEGGEMVKSNLLFSSFKPLLKRAGLPNIRFHDLRHTAATLMLWQGIHPKVVSEMLGHASVAITLDLYSHVLPNMQREAVERMNTLLSDPLSDA